jgi:hypothetical protein
MAENTTPPGIFELVSQPGVKRDGTDFDSIFWQDAQWVRFQRGRPRKIGGYRELSDQLYGPVRGVYVDSRSSGSSIHTFSQWGVEKLSIDSTGTPTTLDVRTPVGFSGLIDYAWQTASMFQSGGAGTPTLVASATPDLTDLASDTSGSIYQGDVTGLALMTAVSDGAPIVTSGGCCVLQPFLFVYGSNGLIRNSNPNDISAASGWTTGGANKASTANVAGSKIVKGLAMRGGGQSPAGLFWALDALIRVTYVGGTTLWNYDTLSDDVSVLSKSGIVEYDNAYYWVGVDRFYVYNGLVQELPNQMNLNWFFDNINFANRQKVWATKVTRFGEIWWFFPFGESTECNAAVIFNLREKTWYDARLLRTAGSPAKTYPRPIFAGSGATTTALPYTPTAGMFHFGETVTGSVSLATGVVQKAAPTQLNLINVVGTFTSGETIDDGVGSTGTTTAAPFSQPLSRLWDHETGVDEVSRSGVTAVESYIESSNVSWVAGSPTSNAQQGYNFQMRVLRFEPDFVMAGNMTMTVRGRAYAQSSIVDSEVFTITPTTEFVDLREQRRLASIKLESNVVGGNFQMGRSLLTAEPGDERG